VHQRSQEDDTWYEPFDSERPASATPFDIFATSPGPWDAPPENGGGRVVLGDGTTPVPHWIAPEPWAASTCLGCSQSTLWRGDLIVYPRVSPAPAPNPDMPAAPRELYLEAASVMAVSRRAGAAMARATLERLLIELDPSAKKDARLDDRIIDAMQKVSSSLGEALTIIRHVGNEALHVDDTPDAAVVLVLDAENTEIVDVIFAAINDLVDELVTKPAARARLLDAVPQSVRAAVDRKKAAVQDPDTLSQ
jgi:hypothetical protein